MQVSPYWRSVWEVALLLLGVSLLSIVTGTLLSFLAFGPIVPVVAVVQALVPIVGALVYLDWRWGWRADTVGLTGGRHLRWLPAGLGLGALALLLTHGLSIPFGGPLMPVLSLNAEVWWAVLPAVISVFAVEVLFRGGATARLQAELAPKEALWTALALPLVAYWLSGSFVSVPTGIHAAEPWTLFFTAALTLLYIRTGALWLNLGLSLVVNVLPMALGWSMQPQAALLLWAVVAIGLTIMAWNRLGQMPRRFGSQRSHRGRI